MKTAGIYWIRNKNNNHIYIGSSVNVDKRRYKHVHYLGKGIHDSPHLQAAWDKYGRDVFEFEIILICDPSMLRWYEQQFLDQWKPEYNISPSAGGYLPGHKHSGETIRKLKAARKRQKFSAAHYAQLGDRFRGEGNPSAKLTEVQVIEIKTILAKEKKRYGLMAELGRKYDVHPSTIELIHKGKKWKHVIIEREF